MPIRIFKILLVVVILVSLLVGGVRAADSLYEDDFKTLTNSWKQVDGTWTASNGTVHATGGRPALIFNEWNGKKYIFKSDFSADDTKISDYKQEGLYFYYEDENNYARIVFGDDNRPDKKDALKLESKGVSFVNEKRYIDIDGNETFEFSPDDFREVKIVRLDRKVQVYYQGNLAYTAEFKDENPAGRVGYDVYASTGYFDDFYLRPITMSNATNYVDKLQLNPSTPTYQLTPIHSLRLVEASNDQAVFSLTKLGKPIDTTIASPGDTVTLHFQNGDEAVSFRVTEVFTSDDNSIVKLEDVISASTPQRLNLALTPPTTNQSYYQNQNITTQFTISNNGQFPYTDTPKITIATTGTTETLHPRLNLSPGESRTLSATVGAPGAPGGHRLTVSIESEYLDLQESSDYTVRALNPPVRALSADLGEDSTKGIVGTVRVDTRYSPGLVDWDQDASIRVYLISDGGREVVYSRNVSIKDGSFDVLIPYGEFYEGDGQYLVSVSVGGARDDVFLGDLKPASSIVVDLGSHSSPLEFYPELTMLFLGLFAGVSVRNHVRRDPRSLPLEGVLVACGVVVLAVALIKVLPGLATTGILLAGTGVCAHIVRDRDPRVGRILRGDSYLHDFAGLLVVFVSAGYIVVVAPGWSLVVIVGALVAYYVAINLYGDTLGSQ